MQEISAGKFHFEPPSLVSLFDHLVGDSEQPWRQAEAECLGGVEIDHELELGRLHDRQVRRLRALEDAANIDTSQAISLGDAGSVAHQTASFGKRQRNELYAAVVGKRAGTDQNRIN